MAFRYYSGSRARVVCNDIHRSAVAGRGPVATYVSLRVLESHSVQLAETPHHHSLFYYVSPFRLGSGMWRHRGLIRELVQREVQNRYNGSALGLFWSLASPMALLAIYTFVFSVVFGARWPGARTGSMAESSLVLFCGLIVFTVFSECVTRAATLIVGVPNFVKKVVFPLELLPVSILGSAIFHGLVGIAILLVAQLLLGGQLRWTLVLLPVVALPLLLLTLGLSWLLASLGVFLRDLQHTVPPVTQVLFFATPIVYPLERIPEPWRAMIQLNPMTAVVENFREVLLWGDVPNWLELGQSTLLAAMVMVLGYAWFMKTKHAFADVL